MAMIRVMQATKTEREGRWPSEGFMRMGSRAFLGLYGRKEEDLTRRARRSQRRKRSEENPRAQPGMAVPQKRAGRARPLQRRENDQAGGWLRGARRSMCFGLGRKQRSGDAGPCEGAL